MEEALRDRVDVARVAEIGQTTRQIGAASAATDLRATLQTGEGEALHEAPTRKAQSRTMSKYVQLSQTRTPAKKEVQVLLSPV